MATLDSMYQDQQAGQYNLSPQQFNYPDQQTGQIDWNIPQYSEMYDNSTPSVPMVDQYSGPQMEPNPEPSFMDRYFGPEGSKQRVDNYWRAGSAGAGALGILGGIYDAGQRRRTAQNAANWLESKQDPNRSFYQSRLAELFQNRGNYSQDPQSAARTAALREAADRQNAAQGRSGYSAAQQQALNDASAYAQNNEIANLLKALEGGDQLAASAANIRAATPSYNPTQAIPYLQGLFTTGQDYTRAMGFSSEFPNLTPEMAAQVKAMPLEKQAAFLRLPTQSQQRVSPYL